MDLISITNGALRYHKSASNLTVVNEYKNAQQNDISTNFAVLPANKSFLWWNRKHSKAKQEDDSCVELWRVKKDNENELERLNKTKGSGLSAVACSNSIPSTQLTCAMGYLNGEVKVKLLTQNYKAAHNFASQQSSVINLDYICNNENIASTHENGTINIFSLNTTIKFDTIKLDGASTLSRFHPSKRSILGVASYQGTVTLYDIFAKKPVFKNIGAHSAPCADIAFTENSLLSCGYDSVINIFDIRKQKVGINIKEAYGWTTIALSKCSSYIVGGNMKGELISYDMRNTKKVLASARVESGGHKITRVDFLGKQSSGSEEPSAFIDLAAKESLGEPAESPLPANDSFTDMLGYQKGRISDFSSSIVNQSRLSTDSNSDFQPKKIVDFESPERTEEIPKTRGLYNKRRSSLRTPLLQHIHEEQTDKENDSNFMNTPKNGSSSRNTSTPAVKVTFDQDDVIEVDDESFKSVEATSKPVEVQSNFDLRKEFENLEKKLSEKIHIEVGMMNFDEENRYIKVMSQIVDQRQRLQERVNMIEECMKMLLNDDFKINRIMELQAENDELRAQNQELIRRMSR